MTREAILNCPRCEKQHIDEGEWAKRLHHTHRCLHCGHEFRIEPYTFGVAELPKCHWCRKPIVNDILYWYGFKFCSVPHSKQFIDYCKDEREQLERMFPADGSNFQ